MSVKYEKQRLVHCEDCGGLYAQYVEHEYPQCDDCLIIELGDAVRTAHEWEALSQQLTNDETRNHRPEEE